MVKIGTVSSTPSTPKAIITGLRPDPVRQRADDGLQHMKRNSAAVMIWLAVAWLKPDVLTRNFCM